VNKWSRPARRLAEFLPRCLSKPLARRGFASTEILTRWTDIVGAEIADRTEPIKILWPRDTAGGEPATLVLQVDGPEAVEIQHLSGPIIESVNRFFGWHAVGRLALRQGPLSLRESKPGRQLERDRAPDFALGLSDIADPGLRWALARLAAAIASQ
jgi:hypothetical protein